MARRRQLPNNQYRCSQCGKRHIKGSQRGAECRNTSPSTRSKSKIPNWNPPESSERISPNRRRDSILTGNGSRPVDKLPQKIPKIDRDTARERAKTTISADPSQIHIDALSFVFDNGGFYINLSNRLIDNLPWLRKIHRGHWLCVHLNDLAKALSPGTYTPCIQKSVRDVLLNVGSPKFIAETLGAASALGTKSALSSIPITQLNKPLRALIPLSCRNFDSCPGRQ